MIYDSGWIRREPIWYDDDTWYDIKHIIRNTKKGSIIHFQRWTKNQISQVNALHKLGYVKPVIKITHGYSIDKCYKKVKNIPNDLLWKDVREKAKNIKSNNKQVFTTWNMVVYKINKRKNKIFNKHTYFFTLLDVDKYLRILAKLDYIKKIDKLHYEILEKIPDDLTSKVATMKAYNRIYKRGMKIQKLKSNIINKS